MSRRRKRIGNAIRQGRLAMINHVIKIVTDIVTTTVSVTEIEEVIVTMAVTDRLTLKHQKNKMIRVKTKEAKTMRRKKQANTDSDVLAVILQNKVIFLPCNLYIFTILRCKMKS